MKIIVFAFMIIISSTAFGGSSVGGVVSLPKSLEKKLTPNGVLFVFAKKAGPGVSAANGQPPMAVLKIVNPKFPQNFVLTASNVMIAGTKFEGPVRVMARYSPSGDAISSPDSLEGIDLKNQSVALGTTNLKITLNSK
jgi:hypothetical protein